MFSRYDPSRICHLNAFLRIIFQIENISKSMLIKCASNGSGLTQRRRNGTHVYGEEIPIASNLLRLRRRPRYARQYGQASSIVLLVFMRHTNSTLAVSTMYVTADPHSLSSPRLLRRQTAEHPDRRHCICSRMFWDDAYSMYRRRFKVEMHEPGLSD